MRRIRLGALAALAGIWAASAGAAPGDVRVSTVASGLDHPWSLAFLPDGRTLVTERPGRIRVIGKNGKLTNITGVPKVYAASQGGLFDIVLHPQFARNRLVYLSYAAGTPGANYTRIARARLQGNALADLKVIFQVSPAKDTPVHFGGRMAFLGDGTLAMTTGDGFDYREQAQRLASGLGKIIRITDSGGVPANNPFVRTPGARPAIWSYGHRNPQGLAFDAVSGRLYAHEHGPQGGDEVNIIRRGGNYGWPVATHGLDYSGATISPYQRYKGMIDPIVIWVPSIAPSGLAVYRGAMFPEWQGDLLVGALAGQELRRVDLDSAGRVKGQESILPSLKQRIRDVRVAPDGAILVTIDDPDGKVLRLSR